VRKVSLKHTWLNLPITAPIMTQSVTNRSHYAPLSPRLKYLRTPPFMDDSFYALAKLVYPGAFPAFSILLQFVLFEEVACATHECLGARQPWPHADLIEAYKIHIVTLSALLKEVIEDLGHLLGDLAGLDIEPVE